MLRRTDREKDSILAIWLLLPDLTEISSFCTDRTPKFSLLVQINKRTTWPNNNLVRPNGCTKLFRQPEAASQRWQAINHFACQSIWLPKCDRHVLPEAIYFIYLFFNMCTKEAWRLRPGVCNFFHQINKHQLLSAENVFPWRWLCRFDKSPSISNLLSNLFGRAHVGSCCNCHGRDIDYRDEITFIEPKVANGNSS